MSGHGGYSSRAASFNKEAADFTTRMVQEMDVNARAAGQQGDMSSRALGTAAEMVATRAVTSFASRRVEKSFEEVDDVIKNELVARDIITPDANGIVELPDDLKSMADGVRRGDIGKGTDDLGRKLGDLDDADLAELMEKRAAAGDKAAALSDKGKLGSQAMEKLAPSKRMAGMIDDAVSDNIGDTQAMSSIVDNVRRAQKFGKARQASKAKKDLKKATDKILYGKDSSLAGRVRQMARGAVRAGKFVAHAAKAAFMAIKGFIVGLASNPITLAIAAGVAVIAVVVVLLMGIFNRDPLVIDGLPEMVTPEIVEAAMEAQEETGIPAAFTIAQFIQESRGSYDGMSYLAYKYHNLWGMKYFDVYGNHEAFADPPYVSMSTWEDSSGGGYNTMARFISFDSVDSAFEWRTTYFFEQSRYRTETILEARANVDSAQMARGVAAAGYATDRSYAENLISTMETYNLLQLDNMTLEDYLNGGSLALGAGRGEDYQAANATQKRIVDACYQVPSPGSGYCAKWVSQVYQRAGFAYPYGHGNTMLDGTVTYTDLDQLKVGMAISAQKGSNTSLGNTYGHIGIYIGDGMVMENVGSIRTTPLDIWIANNGRGWIKFGYPATVGRIA